MADTMLFEEALLLAYRDDKGSPLFNAITYADYAIPTGIFAELALAGRLHVELSNPSGPFDQLHKAYNPLSDIVRVIDRTPLGDPETDSVLEQVAQFPGNNVHHWMTTLANRPPGKRSPSVLRRRILERLEQRGILRGRDDRILGLIPVRRYPLLDSSVEDEIRGRLDSLFRGNTPDLRTATLAYILFAWHQVPTIMGFPDADKELYTLGRVKQVRDWLCEGRWCTKSQFTTLAAMTEVFYVPRPARSS